ncbi:MAG: type VI secretion system baseplate subunit TssK [Desulfobacterales bacterium]|nr:type VI secretion system baseplate subunit TssK [Desulfobacterales bacterium]
MELCDKLPEPVQWSEGMLMTPHHFQQNHIYWEAQMQHRTARIHPFFWGIIHMEIKDKSGMVNGFIAIHKLQAVMPDGLILDITPESGHDLRIDLNEARDVPESGELQVFLSVPIRADGAASSSSLVQRFESVQGGYSVDENTGDSKMRIDRLRPNISLHAGKDPGPKYISMPLMKMKKGGDGSFRLLDYLPPILNADGADFLGNRSLGGILREIAANIRKKVNKLLMAVENENSDGMFSSSDAYLNIVTKLVAELPKLEILINSENIHPFDLYLGMAGLMGEICAIDTKPVPDANLPGYNHNDMWPGFNQIIEYISRLLEGINLRYSVILFEEPNKGIFTINLDENWREPHILIEVKSAKNQDTYKLKEWISSCRIGSAHKLNYLKEHRDAGAARRIYKRDKKYNIRAGAGNILAEIPVDGEIVCKGKKLYLISTTEKLMERKPEYVQLFIPKNES